MLKIAGKVILAIGLAFPIFSANSYETEALNANTHYNIKDLYCLAKNIYHEARGESFKGKLAVAQVTMNRVNHPTKWPNDVCDVVYQKVKGSPQFSWTTMKNLKVVDMGAWQEAKSIAYGVLTGDLLLKNFNATHFHNKSVMFAQTKAGSKTIGNHIFY